MKKRLLIADDHELVRAGLVQYLGGCPGIEVVAEAVDGEDTLEKLRSVQADLLMLDMAMPGKCGVELILQIRRLYPELLILVLSMHNETSIVMRAIKAGASGYVCKDCSPQILFDAIQKVLATGKYLSPAMAEQLAYIPTRPEPMDIELVLSERELEIFNLMVAGKSICEIANQLFICDKTVSTHKKNILSKLGLKNIAELVRYAMQRELFL